MSSNSRITFEVVLEKITDEDREQILRITEILEKHLTQLNQQDYQELLNFVMSMNSEWGHVILLKVGNEVQIPHISVMRDKLRHRAISIKEKLAT